MRSLWSKVVIYPNTIEMILEAFKLNKLQKYDPNNSPSKVIRLKPTPINVTLKYQDPSGRQIAGDTVENIPDKSLCFIFARWINELSIGLGRQLRKVILKNGTYDAKLDDWKRERVAPNDTIIFIFTYQ